MQKNIGTTDRILRFLMAIALFAYAFFQESLIALAFGLFVLYEALASWCVLYQILGKNSCDIEKK